MRLTLLVNPAASATSPDARAGVQAALEATNEVEVVVTARRGDATGLARAAAAAGAGAVVVFGGDGTANEAANGLIGTATALAPLPAGSTNVFARTMGFDRDLQAATAQLTAALGSGSTRRVDVGDVGGRCFLFHAGIGFDADVVAQVERRAPAKRRFGQVVFVPVALGTWLTRRDRAAARFTVDTGAGESLEGALAICFVTDPYTYLGPLPIHLDPGMEPGAGLGLLVLRDLRARTVLGALTAALADSRRLPRIPGAELRRGLTKLTVSGGEPVPYQLDGDLAGYQPTLELRHRPGALAVVVP